MTEAFTAACVQITSGPDEGPSVAAAGALIRRARAVGADLILTPETTSMMEPRRRLTFEKACFEPEHRGLAEFRDLAAELGCWLLIGSMVVRLDQERLANRSFLLGPAGQVAPAARNCGQPDSRSAGCQQVLP